MCAACLASCADESIHIACAVPQIRFFTVLRAPEAKLVLCRALLGVKTSSIFPGERVWKLGCLVLCHALFVVKNELMPVPQSKGRL